MLNKVLEMFDKIEHPNEVNVILLFNACSELRTKEALELVKRVSNEMPKSYYSNSNLMTSLLDALMKCGDIEYAQSLFDTCQQKVLSMYGAMMKGNPFYC